MTSHVGRRAVLAALGGLAASGVAVAAAGCTSGAPGAGASPGEPSGDRGDPTGESGTPLRGPAGDWIRTRQAPYGIGHRGAGDVAPEHTLASYRQALDWGARCVEISTVVTADGVPVCLHDTTLDRTTTLRGPVAALTYAQVSQGYVDIPRLGPAWAGARRPRIPRLAEALALVTPHAAVCLEAKESRGFDAVMDVVRRLGVADAVIAKVYCRSGRIDDARRAGFPLFVYAGTADDVAPEFLAATARRLRPDRDALVLPTTIDGAEIADDVVRRAVDSGVPVWAYPVHRRVERARLAGLGVAGFVTPDLSYLLGGAAARTTDDWAAGRLAAGELTRDPYADNETIRWEGDGSDGSITLDAADRPLFVLMGQFAPIARADAAYTIGFDACFRALPTDRTRHVAVAFGHDDDRHWAHREGTADGYHGLLGADGRLSLWRHTQGSPPPEPEQLGPTVATAPPGAGEWMRLAVAVTPETITWSREGFPPVQVRETRHRGGYFLVGRTGADGPVGLRRLTVA